MEKSIKEKLFTNMVEFTASIGWGSMTDMYTIAEMAGDLGCSYYATRKAMKELEAEGLVKKVHYGWSNDSKSGGCYHGWELTEKALEAEEYLQRKREVDEEMRQLGCVRWDDGHRD